VRPLPAGAAGGQPAALGVSYRVVNEDVAATDQKAQDYCGRYGKTAPRKRINEAAGSKIAEYTCS
jgi:hypothetical protein